MLAPNNSKLVNISNLIIYFVIRYWKKIPHNFWKVNKYARYVYSKGNS